MPVQPNDPIHWPCGGPGQPACPPVPSLTTTQLQGEKEYLTTLYKSTPDGSESDAINARIEAIDAELTARDSA